jgi:hypothetical protein
MRVKSLDETISIENFASFQTIVGKNGGNMQRFIACVNDALKI